MANLRDIKVRIKSVQNTTKITHTMEMIATAKSQACIKRIREALPYFQALAEIAGEAQAAGGGGETQGRSPAADPAPGPAPGPGKANY